MEFFDLVGQVMQSPGDQHSVSDAILRWLSESMASLNGWAGSVKLKYDPIIWVLTSILALIPGSFVVYKWWWYRNSRLPARLEDILSKEEKRLKQARAELAMAILKPASTSREVETPLFAVATMKNLLWRLGWSRWWSPNSFKASAAEIELALVEIEQKLHFCARKEALHRAEEAAAYLLKGAVDAARASKLKPSSGDYIQANRSALRHFIRALEIDPNDPEALEYVAHQHRALQEIDLALTHYERLVNISSGSSIEGRILRSRAHRYAGEMLERKFNGSGIQANLSRARDHLDLKDGALDCLPDDCRWTLDHAAIHEVAGRVTEKQGAAQLPGTHYGQALAIYEDILRREPKNMDAKDGRERMIKALADFHADAGAPPNPAPHMLQ